jgi:serine/threonine-protein kinase
MRRVEGKTLHEILVGQRPAGAPPDRQYSRHKLLIAFGSACLAVHFAHTRDVLHCDIKPENLMLGAFGEVYVLDWGLATRAALQAAEAGVGLGGTPGYLAPERVRGQPPDVRADVYALGAVLYELLTLESMHSGHSIRDVFEQTLRGAVTPPSARAPARDIPPELDAICLKATAVDPQLRYATARELHDDLERYMEGDRDLALRRALSKDHAARAASFAQRVAEGGAQDTAARSEALGAVSRALALDPDNPEALRLLVQLLTEPPLEMPPAARREMNAAQRELDRHHGRGGAIALFVVAAVVLVAGLIAGVGSLPSFVTCVGAWLVAAALGVLRVRRPRPDGHLPTYVPIAASIAIAILGACYNPSVITPVVAIPFALGFTLSSDPSRRFLPMICGCIALILPVALEALHLLPSSVAFRDGLWCVVPRMVHDVPTPYPELVVDVLCMVVACVYAIRSRIALHGMQERVFVGAWQLRQLLPKEVVESEPAARLGESS